MSKNKLEKIELLEKKIQMQQDLPHLFAFKKYRWGKEYSESTNKVAVICSSNQIGKSTEQICKAIKWATSPHLWSKLWKSPPRAFFYMYPSSPLATVEFDSKWVPDLLPRGEMANHPVFGWKAQYKAYFVNSIKFNSGVTIYFKTYSQNPRDLQASSPHAIFLDEETPPEIMPELLFRLVATEGHLSAVFTPTLSSEYWREIIETKGEKEKFKGAFKRQVSMYDCMEFWDGEKSAWTEERIERIKATCRSQAEIDRRVYGKFVLDSGLKYPSFVREFNVVPAKPIPADYRIFVGVDIGSGGGENHPSAVIFVAVSPKFDDAIIFFGKRFDNEVTTASDVVEYVMKQKYTLGVQDRVDAVFYDFASADTREIASRMGEQWIRAEKSHAIGEQRLNVLFKNGMLNIFDIPILEPLVYELLSLKEKHRKVDGGDDYCDALRYSISKIPFDWSKIVGSPVHRVEKPPTETELRRQAFMGDKSESGGFDIEDEFEEWNALY